MAQLPAARLSRHPARGNRCDVSNSVTKKFVQLSVNGCKPCQALPATRLHWVESTPTRHVSLAGIEGSSERGDAAGIYSRSF